MTASVSLSVLIVPDTAREVRSNTVESEVRPLVVNPLLNSSARAMPWTPWVLGMSPIILPWAGSTTMTWVAREMNRRWVAGCTSRKSHPPEPPNFTLLARRYPEAPACWAETPLAVRNNPSKTNPKHAADRNIFLVISILQEFVGPFLARQFFSRVAANRNLRPG